MITRGPKMPYIIDCQNKVNSRPFHNQSKINTFTIPCHIQLENAFHVIKKHSCQIRRSWMLWRGNDLVRNKFDNILKKRVNLSFICYILPRKRHAMKGKPWLPREMQNVFSWGGIQYFSKFWVYRPMHDNKKLCLYQKMAYRDKEKHI